MMVRRDLSISYADPDRAFQIRMHQALKLKDAVDGLGLGINVTLIRDRSVLDDELWDMEPEDGAGRSCGWGDETESN